MNSTGFAAALAGGLAVGTIGIGLAAPASADSTGYVDALDSAGLIDHDGKPCNIVNGLCHGQFPDGAAAVKRGMYVCRQVGQGRSRESLVYELSHGEGLMPSSYNAPVIYDAATTYLC